MMAGKGSRHPHAGHRTDKQIDYFNLDHEANPALGFRAIRICLDRVDV